MKTFSASRFMDYAQCGKRYQLTRLQDYSEPEAWYLVGGTAVHLATQLWDEEPGKLLSKTIWSRAYKQTIDEAARVDPDTDTWRTSKGYSGRGVPEGYLEWKAKGLECLNDYIRWRELHPDWEVLGAEIDIECVLPASGITLRGWVDRLFRTPLGSVVIDIKTGSRVPPTSFQLGVYAAGLQYKGYDRPVHGAYYMTKNADITRLARLDNYTVEVLDELASKMWRGIDSEIFLPVLGAQCFNCSASPACYMWSGDTLETRRHDPLNPAYMG